MTWAGDDAVAKEVPSSQFTGSAAAGLEQEFAVIEESASRNQISVETRMKKVCWVEQGFSFRWLVVSGCCKWEGKME